MLLIDLTLIVLGASALAFYFIDGLRAKDGDTFQRFGAVVVLIGAMISLNVQKRTLLGQVDAINASWKSIGFLLEGLSNVDRTTKSVARQLAVVVTSAGLESPWGPVEKIKNMEVGPLLAAFEKIPEPSKHWNAYHNAVECVGTLYLWVGTLVWAYGDKLITYLG